MKILGKCHLPRVDNIVLNFVVDTSNMRTRILKKDRNKKKRDISIPISLLNKVFKRMTGTIRGSIKNALFKRYNMGMVAI